jgi:hypothetical protein
MPREDGFGPDVSQDDNPAEYREQAPSSLKNVVRIPEHQSQGLSST